MFNLIKRNEKGIWAETRRDHEAYSTLEGAQLRQPLGIITIPSGTLCFIVEETWWNDLEHPEMGLPILEFLSFPEKKTLYSAHGYVLELNKNPVTCGIPELADNDLLFSIRDPRFKSVLQRHYNTDPLLSGLKIEKVVFNHDDYMWFLLETNLLLRIESGWDENSGLKAILYDRNELKSMAQEMKEVEDFARTITTTSQT